MDGLEPVRVLSGILANIYIPDFRRTRFAGDSRTGHFRFQISRRSYPTRVRITRFLTYPDFRMIVQQQSILDCLRTSILDEVLQIIARLIADVCWAKQISLEGILKGILLPPTLTSFLRAGQGGSN